jgi:hypothetical protein
MLIEQYRRRVVSDLTFFYLKTAVEKDGDSWRLRATTNAPRLVQAIGTVLERLGGTPVRIEVTELPAPRLGDQLFGVVRVTHGTHASIYRREGGRRYAGSARRERLSAGRGRRRRALAASRSRWLRGLGAGRDAVLRLDAAAFAEWEQAPRATLQRDYLLDDFRLPTGARLPILKDEGKHVTFAAAGRSAGDERPAGRRSAGRVSPDAA